MSAFSPSDTIPASVAISLACSTIGDLVDDEFEFGIVSDTGMTITPDSGLPVKAQAYDLYLRSGLKRAEIADELDIKEQTLAEWIKIDKWKAKKDELQDEAMESSNAHFRQMVSTNQMEVLKRHTDVSKELEVRILNILKKRSSTGRPTDISVGDLVKMAQALKNSTEVSARAAGIHDKMFDEHPVVAPGATPVIVVGLHPQLTDNVSVKSLDPTHNKADPIDITPEVILPENDPF